LQERPLDTCIWKKIPRLLTVEEEGGLVDSVLYMSGQGFPMTRIMIPVNVRGILQRTVNIQLTIKFSLCWQNIMILSYSMKDFTNVWTEAIINA
jgi:hypothetical protein